MNSSFTLAHYEQLESYIPIDMNKGSSWLFAMLLISAVVVFRYFLMVGGFWVVFYKIKPKWTQKRQIYDQLPGKNEQLFEIKWSVISSVFFAFTGALMAWMWQNGYTKLYLKFDQYSLWYMPLSWFILFFLHDAYFYWAHVWMHIPKYYRKYHATHHASLKPSPWASFSFHPVESFLNAIIIPIIIIFLPLHPVIILLHLTVMTLSAITNHMGFEILPKKAASHWFFKWFVSGVHHTEHHKYFRYNYGLFFTWWDIWFKTEHPKYVEEFDQLFERD